MALGIAGSKVLVLGGRGFLGRHLVDLLVKEGCLVRIFDRPERRAVDREGCPSTVEVFEGDFIRGEGLAQALVGVDVVFHLISTTVPSDSNADPIGDVNSNLLGTLRLLSLMRDAEVKRIVYASSGGTIYGNPYALPVPENHPLGPICSYGVVKVAIEHYLGLHSKLHGLVSNVLRISNPYGAHQTRIGTQGVISTFLNRLMKDEPIEIWGDGSMVRDYVYVTDVSRALLLAGRRQKSGTFNIGSGIGHRVSDILRILQNRTGLTGTVRYLPHRKFDVERIYLDVSLARDELGWKPEYSLERGCSLYCDLLGIKPPEELALA
jgi:UDP-glucose 4-epimerase